MDLYSLANWVFDKGFVLTFAIYCIWRLDKFLTSFAVIEARELDILNRIAARLDSDSTSPPPRGHLTGIR